jgi:translation elongation factor EF-Ts
VRLFLLQAAQAELLQLGSNLAMHSAGMSSQFISRQAMPQAALDAARADLASATEAQMPGKPAEVLAKIVDGKVAKWCKDVSIQPLDWVWSATLCACCMRLPAISYSQRCDQPIECYLCSRASRM